MGDQRYDGKPLEPAPVKPEPNLSKFTKSKWESVDETELEAQGLCSQCGFSPPTPQNGGK